MNSESEIENEDRAQGASVVDESLKLSRFAARLVGEATHLGADSIRFNAEKDVMHAVLLTGDQELKKINLKASWFFPVCRWLIDRFSIFPCDPTGVPDSSQIESISTEFNSSLRIGGQVFSFHVKKNSNRGGRHSLVLNDLKAISLSSAIDQLGLVEHARGMFERIIEAEAGILIVAAPDDENLAKSRACMLSLANLHHLGSLQDERVRQKMIEVSRLQHVLVTIKSDDALDALIKLREFRIDMSQLPLTGIVCQGFARKVCPSCAREAVIDAKLLATLPEGLKLFPRNTYFVGRGCEACGEAGYSGEIGIQSIIQYESELKDLVARNADQAVLADRVYWRGTKPLLEDGVKKALAGRVTLEALFELTRVLPAVYNKYLAQVPKEAEEVAAVAVKDDFFAGDASGIFPKPLSGKSVFNREAAVDENDQPLFARKAPQRTKPLLLVVEDDADQRSILEMVLKAAEYDVLLSKDGVEALSLIEREKPDLVLTDLMMPNMDGTELVSRIRSNELISSTPVIILTAVSDVNKEYTLLDKGADDYCEKTVQRKILLKRIGNLLRRSR